MLGAIEPDAAYWLTWIVILFGLLLGHRLTSRSYTSEPIQWLRIVGSAFGCWVLLSPLLYIAAGEIHHLARPREQIPLSPSSLFLLLSGATMVAYAARRGRRLPGVAFGALSVLMSTIVLNGYNASITYNFYDMFHLGEKILPLQQWSSFSLLPFVDYMPTHGLADVFPSLSTNGSAAANPWKH
ncbi:MAG: hypothetical protein U5K56_13490 [Halioglobus sp.]|nr:hypothetical protein [Halioglobus sp.]